VSARCIDLQLIAHAESLLPPLGLTNGLMMGLTQV